MNHCMRFGLAALIAVMFFSAGCMKAAVAPPSTPAPAPANQDNGAQAARSVTQQLAVPKGVPILMYHKIGTEPNNDAVISQERFAEQMAYLRQHQYTPVTLDELYAYLTEKKPLPIKPVVLTFDDGYRDTYEIAMPLLKKYGFRSMMFIPAGDVGKNISWAELKEMKAAGMEIGSHSYSHTDLDELSRQEQAAEISRAKQMFDKELNQNTRWFCYPNGSFNKTTKELLAANGITMAVTINPGWVTAGDDVLTLKRVWVGNPVTLDNFAERLSRADYPQVK